MEGAIMLRIRCIECKKMCIVTRRSGRRAAKYCSRACYQAARRKQFLEDCEPPTCAFCRNEMKSQARVFCSDTCWYANRQEGRERLRARVFAVHKKGMTKCEIMKEFGVSKRKMAELFDMKFDNSSLKRRPPDEVCIARYDRIK